MISSNQISDETVLQEIHKDPKHLLALMRFVNLIVSMCGKDDAKNIAMQMHMSEDTLRSINRGQKKNYPKIGHILLKEFHLEHQPMEALRSIMNIHPKHSAVVKAGLNSAPTDVHLGFHINSSNNELLPNNNKAQSKAAELQHQAIQSSASSNVSSESAESSSVLNHSSISSSKLTIKSSKASAVSSNETKPVSKHTFKNMGHQLNSDIKHLSKNDNIFMSHKILDKYADDTPMTKKAIRAKFNLPSTIFHRTQKVAVHHFVHTLRCLGASRDELITALMKCHAYPLQHTFQGWAQRHFMLTGKSIQDLSKDFGISRQSLQNCLYSKRDNHNYHMLFQICLRWPDDSASLEWTGLNKECNIQLIRLAVRKHIHSIREFGKRCHLSYGMAQRTMTRSSNLTHESRMRIAKGLQVPYHHINQIINEPNYHDSKYVDLTLPNNSTSPKVIYKTKTVPAAPKIIYKYKNNIHQKSQQLSLLGNSSNGDREDRKNKQFQKINEKLDSILDLLKSNQNHELYKSKMSKLAKDPRVRKAIKYAHILSTWNKND